eukprot:scaffold102680_cov33-Tisochrysis_lutea.AAC.3
MAVPTPSSELAMRTPRPAVRPPLVEREVLAMIAETPPCKASCTQRSDCKSSPRQSWTDSVSSYSAPPTSGPSAQPSE